MKHSHLTIKDTVLNDTVLTAEPLLRVSAAGACGRTYFIFTNLFYLYEPILS
jgi:hypothetical protein